MAIFGYGADDDKNGTVSFSESVRDMFNGGGAGQSGDTFEGGLSGISNAIGATPKGSNRKPTGIANIVSGATGVGGRANPLTMAVVGALTGGLGGAAMGALRASQMNKAKDAKAPAGTPPATGGGLGLFKAAAPAAAPAPSGPTYSTSNRDTSDTAAKTAKTAAAPAGDTAKSRVAAATSGSFQAIPNPNYDPTNPMSSPWLSNPTYEQLLAYKNAAAGAATGQPTLPQLRPGMNYNPAPKVGPMTTMAEGGKVPAPANEKSVITAAVGAIKGEMDKPAAAVALAAFVQKYGKDSLRDLVDRVQSGELDQTVASSTGKLAGPGDGMNDRIPATIGGQQDVLLSDGEFIVPADVVSGLGNGSSDAGSKQLEKFIARVRNERTGKTEQPRAINPATALPA